MAKNEQDRPWTTTQGVNLYTVVEGMPPPFPSQTHTHTHSVCLSFSAFHRSSPYKVEISPHSQWKKKNNVFFECVRLCVYVFVCVFVRCNATESWAKTEKKIKGEGEEDEDEEDEGRERGKQPFLLCCWRIEQGDERKRERNEMTSAWAMLLVKVSMVYSIPPVGEKRRTAPPHI